MLHFILAVLFTVSLYLIMRSFGRYNVNALHAVVFNYLACVGMGFLLLENRAEFSNLSWSSNATLLSLALGVMYVVVFVLIGISTQKAGVTVTSLASNMSLVIPVLFGLFVFKNNNKDFTWINYLGLIAAVVALVLSTLGKKEKNTTSSPLVLLLPLLLFISSGTNNTLINYLSSTFYTPAQTPLFVLISCVGAVVVGHSLLLIRVLFQNEKIAIQSLIGGLVLGIPNFLSFYFLLKSLSDFGNSAAYVFPIYNILCMLLSAGAAWVLFKEKLQPINKLGLIVAILAIILISYQELGL
jgi:drug/metabolite transporter (DMT)-like permease